MVRRGVVFGARMTRIDNRLMGGGLVAVAGGLVYHSCGSPRKHLIENVIVHFWNQTGGAGEIELLVEGLLLLEKL